MQQWKVLKHYQEQAPQAR